MYNCQALFLTLCLSFFILSVICSTKRGVEMEIHLKDLRKNRGLSQEEMAEKLSVKTSRYGTWERGERMLSLAQAFDCAVILNCSIDEIAGHTLPQTFSDPRQAELNRCWNATDEARQATVLQVARDAAGASGSRQTSDGSQSASPPGVMSA